MADQTHGAVDSLLGLLSSAIKDEVNLLGGLQGDMQFIKDEMDSMNGFLLHLTRTETEHDDQQRAWMKQVREITNIAEDCIALYKRDFERHPKGLWDYARSVLRLPRTMPARHRLATMIRELKVRVRDVGERRQRYGVKVPPSAGLKTKLAARQDNTADNEEKRDAFRRYLEDDPSFNEAIKHLPPRITSEADHTIRAILKSCEPDRTAMKMFLCALFAYPHGTKEELEKLKKKIDGGDMPEEVKIFCYSKLTTHYKSCLQYLTAFYEEDSISRTSLVRRWAAERLVVAKEEEHRTLEQEAEDCFDELVFRGFVCRSEPVAAGKVKSCKIDEAIRDFVLRISKSENFVDNLPTHLKNQLEIRKIVIGKPQQRPQAGQYPGDAAAAAEGKDPLALDKMMVFLKSLPPLYRLNVLDLGGCRGLTERQYLKTICKVLWLKYLSLRNTDVRRLPRRINNLRQLETLDIRQTKLPPTGIEHIFLPKLKHLLASRVDDSSQSTVRIPRRIGEMRGMEILSHVQVFDRGVKLEEVGKLPKLRKLGVVHPCSQDNIKLSECLRSLSIWIRPLTNGESGTSPPLEQPKAKSLSINGAIGNEVLRNWINVLANFSKVTLCETSLPSHSLQILGRLEGLRCLRLRHGSFVEPSLAFKDAEFGILELLLIEDDTITGIQFQPGAAPKLEKIVWWLSTSSMDIISDMVSETDHLPMLKVVELKGHRNCELRPPLKQAIAALPNPTRITEGPDENAGRDVTIAATVEGSKAVNASV